MQGMTRRRFIHHSLVSVGTAGAVASAARAVVPSSTPAAASSSILGANEKIRLGLIGGGGMGCGDLRAFLRNDDVDCPVVCDVDDAHLADAVQNVQKARGKRPETVKDFRRLIDRKDIDVCLVGTPDHWHALPTIYACQAGKDVYVEKPLATSIGEGRAMLEAARRYNRVVQMGTQWHSAEHFASAVAYVHSGKLGKIRLVRAWAYLSWVHGVGQPQDEPEAPKGVDYDLWLGPAPKRPFNKARFHFSFRWFWDYAGGLMTDWGVHLINIAMWAMKVQAPTRVTCSGGKYVLDDIAETPDTQCTVYEFPGFLMTWEHQMEAAGATVEGREHGLAFYGTQGRLVLDAHGWEVVPGKDKKLPAEKHESKGDGRPEHIRNLLDCVRSRQQPIENLEIGHAVSTTALLGNLALLTKRAITWDAQKEQIVGDEQANQMLTRPYRAPWKLEV